MNWKRLAMLLGAVLMLGMVGLAARSATAQEGPNLLVNPGFEEGHHHQNNIAEITVPDGWTLHWLDGVAFEGTNGIIAYRPESVVWNIADGPLDERTLFWRDGIYTFKVFKSWAPMYAALSQDVSNLQVGRRYRLVAPIYTDIYEDFQGGKIAPADLSSGMIRMGASPVGATWRDPSQITYSAWWTAGSVTPFYLAYQTFVWDFTATQPNMTVWIEFASTYPYLNNGFFMDTFGLYALDSVDNTVSQPAGQGNAQPVVPAGPTSTPLPPPTPRSDGAIVHVVQSGDTLWTIAIQYASAMELPPEQALPRIRELNNDPTFINAGQELVIVPPSAQRPVATEVPAEPTAEADEAAAEITTETIVETAVPLATAEPELSPTPALNSICVSIYEDANGDGTRNIAAEGLLADAALTITRGGNTIASYVSDGLNESTCFESLEAGTYQVQFFPPADYQVTTADNWAVAIDSGIMLPVEFGAQRGAPAAVAQAPQETDTGAMAAADTASPLPTPAPAVTTDSDSGLFTNVGTIILIIAVGLVLLAGIGVFLLRRG